MESQRLISKDVFAVGITKTPGKIRCGIFITRSHLDTNTEVAMLDPDSGERFVLKSGARIGAGSHFKLEFNYQENFPE